MMHPTALGGLRPLVVLAAFAAAAFAQLPLTFGNVFVQRVGDGSAALSNAANPVFLDEYTPTGTLVQTIAMPIAASGSNQPLTQSGSATSEGFLNVSSNGLYLTLVGYQATPGTVTIATSANPPVGRVIARIDVAGTVDTSTVLGDAYGGGNIRSVASDDGNRFWVGGNAQGVRFVSNLGATTSTLVGGTPGNTRVLNIYNGQLYASAASGVFHGLLKVGTDLPTLVGTGAGVIEPGFAITAGPSTYDYYFASPTRVYVADDRTTGAGGILRYDLVGGVWTLAYTLTQSATQGCRGLTGFTQNGVTTLWATSNGGTGVATELVTVTDNGLGSPFTVLATSPLNTAYRGVRFFGLPTTLSRIPASCGAMDIVGTGNAQIGTDVVFTLKNSAFGLGLIGFGTTPGSVPFCNCTIVHDFGVVLFGPQVTFPLPNNPIYIGLPLFTQGFDFLAPGGCPDPTFTLTDGYSFVVQ